MNCARVCVEIAFGRLKARWRRISKKLDVHHTLAPKIVAACCALHNIVQEANDTFVNSWAEQLENAELIFHQPSDIATKYLDNYEGHNLRLLLSEYLAKNHPLRKSRMI